MLFQSILATAVLVTSAAAGATCGRIAYTQAELNSCRLNACAYDNRKGPGGYPHAFSNFEGFKWTVAKTYTLYNYPMGKGGAYNGGTPGPDRCVIGYNPKTTSCILVGAITHTGATGNGFRQCTANSS